MIEKETGGRAFPWCGDLNNMPSINLGMTLRDYFAAAALQGLLADSNAQPFDGEPPEKFRNVVAAAAWAYADAMIFWRDAA